MTMNATYSPEDNKLRLYSSTRLSAEDYARVKEAGFKWAPRQELFVAPAWSCAREDLLRDMCGDIEPEEMTMAERAELKAERLTEHAERRLQERNAYQRAADHYSERFASGQPILVGHHSERSARVAQKRVQSAMDQAAKRERTADWHLYRASGALANANHKNSDRTRARRIETLLAEYRDKCRDEKQMIERRNTWRDLCKGPESALRIIQAYQGSYSDAYKALEAAPDTWEAVRASRLEAFERALSPDGVNARWKAHILARLGYERDLLGPVSRFSGPVTPGVVQVFARTWGVDKPKAVADGDDIGLTADSALPPFISENENGVTLSHDAWRDLFQALGYEPPAAVHSKAATAPPLLNIDAEALESASRYGRREVVTLTVLRITKAQYAKVYADYKGTSVSACGLYRFRTVVTSAILGAGSGYGLSAVFLTDSKVHPVPVPVATADAA